MLLLALSVMDVAAQTAPAPPPPVPAATTPTSTGLSETSAVAGSGDFTLTVTGTNFVSNSRVVFGDALLATTFVSATSLTAAVPAGALTHPRTVSVLVYNGHGSLSNSVPFQVTPASPPPTVTSISPTSVQAGSAAFPLTGTGFGAGSVVLFGGMALTPDPTSATTTSLTVTVPASAVAYPRNVSVAVSNGESSGHSAPVAFSVTPPTAEVLYRVNPHTGASNAGVAARYAVTGLPAGTTLDLTLPASLTLATVATATLPAAPVYATGDLTLTQKTVPGRSSTGFSYYESAGTDMTLIVLALPDGQYRVYLEASGVDLSSVDQTLHVTVTLNLGGRTFTAQAQPVLLHD